MSTASYSIDDYGLVFNDEQMRILYTNLFGISPECEEEELEGYEIAETVLSRLDLCYVSDFTGEAFYINDDGSTDWFSHRDMYSGDMIYYISLNHYPRLFGAAYDSFDDIVSELRGGVGKYLPEDFDYRHNIRHVIGTYYG